LASCSEPAEPALQARRAEYRTGADPGDVTELGCRRFAWNAAETKHPVKDKLKRFALFARLRQEVFFLTIETGVGSYLETHPVDWVDWENGGSWSGEAIVERRLP
jgi:hypothetical protein